MVVDSHTSDLAKAIVERSKNRQTVEVDLGHVLFGINNKNIAKIAIRVPTKLEQDRAWSESYRYVNEIAGKLEEPKNDAALLEDARTAFIAFECCRDVADPKYPAFPGPRWMCEHLTPEELGILLNAALDVRRKLSPQKTALTVDAVEAMATNCAVDSLTENRAALALISWPRELLVEMLITLSGLWFELKSQVPNVPTEGEPDAGAVSDQSRTEDPTKDLQGAS